MKICLMYTARHCQDLSVPFPWLTWYSFAISKCRNFWWIYLAVSMIQSSKMSGSSEPQIYVSPVEIQHYFSNELIHFPDIGSLKYNNGFFFFYIIALLHCSFQIQGYIDSRKLIWLSHYMLPHAYILYVKSYGRGIPPILKLGCNFTMTFYFILSCYLLQK
jgi:hypothetical protein